MGRSVTETWIRVAVVAAGIAAFGVVLHAADLRGAAALLAAAGPWLALALVPYVAQMACDALAWRTLLAALGPRVAWQRLFAIRLATEAVLMSVPAGGMFGEALKPYLLHRVSGVAIADTIASIAAKKCLLIWAQAAYLGLAVVIGHAILSGSGDAILGGGGLLAIAVAAAAVLAVVAAVATRAVVGGRLAGRFERGLRALPSARLRGWLDGRGDGFAAADVKMRSLDRSKATPLTISFGLLMAAWMVETAETWLILHLVGVDLSFGHALVMEAMVVLIRSVAFFVPAGLGVQDAGYLAFLRGFAVLDADASAGAFMLLKRGKELAWIGLGYLSLVALHLRAGARGLPSHAVLPSPNEAA